MSLQVYNWQCASTELAICTAHIDGCRAGPRALMHGLHHHMLRVKTILAGFNLAVSTPTTKPPKFSLFSLILDQDMICTVDVSLGLL